MSILSSRVVRTSCLGTFLAFGLIVSNAHSAAAQTTLVFDPSSSCVSNPCVPFGSFLDPAYGTGGGVAVSNGVLGAFGDPIGGLIPGLFWGGGFGPFSSGFGFGDQSTTDVGVFAFSDPGHQLQFLGMDLTSNDSPATAYVKVYDLLGNLVWTGGGGSYTFNSGDVVPTGAAPAILGGFVVEFTMAPVDPLSNLWIDNLEFGLDGAGAPQSTVPEPATMSLVALGLVGMAGAGFRKRAR
jgi:hypothetical protein